MKTNEVAAHARKPYTLLRRRVFGRIQYGVEPDRSRCVSVVTIFDQSACGGEGSSLKEGESWFYARELFAPQFLEGLTATSFLGVEEGLPEKMAANLSDLVTTTRVFQSLVEKGVFEAWKKMGEPTRFQHSAAKDWMTADGLLDRVLIHEENDGKLGNYHFQKKGILEVSQKDQSLSYRKLDDIPMEDFF